MIKLGAACGTNAQDLTGVFDKLGSSSKKIAVTQSDGITECYVEIELWDDANEIAILHVKVPSVSSSVATVLYLYYDAAHADNDTYVGDTGEAAAQSVWDSNFVGVWHMNAGSVRRSGAV